MWGGGISNNNQPSIDFTYNINDLEVSFKAYLKGINESDIKEYLWEFGDGASSTAKSPTHTYNQAGLYDVILKVVYDNNKILTNEKHIIIDTMQDNQPSIDFTYNSNNLEVSFKAYLKGIDELEIKEYLWEFGDGASSAEKAPTHTYNQAGLYDVILKVIYDNNKILTNEKHIIVDTMQDNQSSIDFIYNINDLEVSFTVDLKGINESDIKGYWWEFGDGASSAEKSPTHTYNKSGTYNVWLIVDYNDSQLYAAKEITIDSNSIRNLFANGFGNNQNLMYYALHIKGKSNIQADKTGLFAQKSVGLNGKYSEDYARDLVIQPKGITQPIQIPFSNENAGYKQLGLSDVYSVDYGWTDKDGLLLDMPFYFGYSNFTISKNSNGFVSFISFAVVDMTSQSGLMDGYDYPDFIRCNDGMFKFDIPMNEYNANIHKNIALFTVEFTNTCSYTVNFDGFIEKE